jgi:hypothetical protein
MLPGQTLASPKSFNDDSIQGMFFTQALYAAKDGEVPSRLKAELQTGALCGCVSPIFQQWCLASVTLARERCLISGEDTHE